MKDLGTLRRALQAPAPDPGRLHLGEIMARGRRLRRRRRALAAGGFACLAAVLATAGIAVGHLGRTEHPMPQFPLSAGHSPGRNPNAPYGAVIHTGIKSQTGELVFFMVRVHVKELPGTTFGIMGGYRTAAGHLAGAVETNETSGPDTSPGFHAVEAPINGLPEFGYYAGPAAKITGTVGGQKVRASVARWSVNRKIVIFWFSTRDNLGGQDVTGLAAVSAHGRKLPAGHNGVGHG